MTNELQARIANGLQSDWRTGICSSAFRLSHLKGEGFLLFTLSHKPLTLVLSPLTKGRGEPIPLFTYPRVCVVNKFSRV
jgi:hypothetical protein